MAGFKYGHVIAAINTTVEHFKDNSCALGKVEHKKIEIIHTPDENDMGIMHMTLIHLECEKPETVDSTVATLHGCPFVVFVEPNFTGEFHEVPNDPILEEIHEVPNDPFLGEFHAIPNDPLFGELYGMQMINAPNAWRRVIGNPNTLVGILDSGIDDRHPDLRQNLRLPNNPRFSDFRDNTGHGTHVAGTIGAIGNNRLGVVGVCWQVGLVIFKIGNEGINLASAISAIQYATTHNIPILNCSWGGRQHSDSLRFALQQYNGLVIVSAGNNGTNNDNVPMYPASYRLPNIISVAATDKSNQIARFSNFGQRNVHIAAPGADILSTDIGNQYRQKSGTSMAAPHVAGAAALLKVFRPNITTVQIRNIILSTATRTPATNGRVSTGILNVGAMINEAMRLA